MTTPTRAIIAYGTETGNAELAAVEVEAALSPFLDSEFVSLTELELDQLTDDTLLVVCCSTYGDGEYSDGADVFAETLNSERPDFSGLSYAIFGLGDTTYETYNFASINLSNLLQERGATRVGEHGMHDASSADFVDSAAQEWAATLVPVVRELVEAA